jgi:hypothetical protein
MKFYKPIREKTNLLYLYMLNHLVIYLTIFMEKLVI